jgi:predicted PhzF superfamily epimerase YddE/YHI9
MAAQSLTSGSETTARGVPMNNVMALVPKERLRQDAEPIAAIYRNLGVQAAEQVVARALAELAHVMAEVADQVRLRDLAPLPRNLRRLQRLSENMGLVSLGQIALDAHLCLAANDSTAFTAVWARLQRVAERSFAPVGDVVDRSV